MASENQILFPVSNPSLTSIRHSENPFDSGARIAILFPLSSPSPLLHPQPDILTRKGFFSLSRKNLDVENRARLNGFQAKNLLLQLPKNTAIFEFCHLATLSGNFCHRGRLLKPFFFVVAFTTALLLLLLTHSTPSNFGSDVMEQPCLTGCQKSLTAKKPPTIAHQLNYFL